MCLALCFITVFVVLLVLFIFSVLWTCVGIHLLFGVDFVCFFRTFLVICTHQFDRLDLIFGLLPFSFTWQRYTCHDTD